MFFKSIEPHLNGMNLNIVISKSETGLVVSVLPQLTCKDEAKGNIVPILLKGTVDELDAQFAGIIQQPLEKVSGISTNLIQFEASVERTEAENAITKSKKDASKKLTDKADKFLDEANKFIKEDKISAAILKIEGALKFAPDYKKALDLLAKHKVVDNTPDMFAIVEEVVPIVEVKEVVPEAVKIVPPVLPETPVIPIAQAPTSMKEVGMEEQQKQETISPEKQEKVEAMLVEEEAIGRENEAPVVPQAIQEIADASPNIIIASVPPQVSQADKDNKPVSLKGTAKPTRKDMEPMDEFEIRLAAWKVYNPEVVENPAATIPSATPIVEDKSEMQIMTEEQTASREAAFNAEKTVVPVAPIVPPSNNENIILG